MPVRERENSLDVETSRRPRAPGNDQADYEEEHEAGELRHVKEWNLPKNSDGSRVYDSCNEGTIVHTAKTFGAFTYSVGTNDEETMLNRKKAQEDYQATKYNNKPAPTTIELLDREELLMRLDEMMTKYQDRLATIEGFDPTFVRRIVRMFEALTNKYALPEMMHVCEMYQSSQWHTDLSAHMKEAYEQFVRTNCPEQFEQLTNQVVFVSPQPTRMA